jgi:hypothetical protein
VTVGEDPALCICNSDPWKLLLQLQKIFFFWFTAFAELFLSCSFMSPFGFLQTMQMARGHALAQLVGATHCKPQGRGFDSRQCHWNFSLRYFFQPQYGPGVDSAFNREECQGYFLGGKGLTNLSHSYAD